MIVFKGNASLPDPSHPGQTLSQTGVYFRVLSNAPIAAADPLAPAGGVNPVVTIADSNTLIPGASTRFGSVAAPSAAGAWVVFTGFDNEAAPTLGGIFLAALTGPNPTLTPLVRLGDRVPGESKSAVFRQLSESLAFDGRFVAFWGAWGSETTALVLACPSQGNQARRAFCRQQYPNGFATSVPVHQGIFVLDTRTGVDRAVAKAPGDVTDFLYWKFTGAAPGAGGDEDDSEPARWRSEPYLAVSGLTHGQLSDVTVAAAFLARTGTVVNGAYQNPLDALYLGRQPGNAPLAVLAATGMNGTGLDPAAVDATGAPLPVTALGLERDGFRGHWLVINAGMGTEAAGWAGIYLTEIH